MKKALGIDRFMSHDLRPKCSVFKILKIHILAFGKLLSYLAQEDKDR